MEGNEGKEVFATQENYNSQSILDAGSTVKSASKIKLELKRGSLKESALTPKLSIPSLKFWLHFTLICTFQRFRCMLITIQNEKCVLNTLFHFEDFNLLFCANAAITT